MKKLQHEDRPFNNLIFLTKQSGIVYIPKILIPSCAYIGEKNPSTK
jgi:hypothetical protein